MIGAIEVPVTCQRKAYVIANSLSEKRSLAVLLVVSLAATFVITATATKIVDFDIEDGANDGMSGNWGEMLRTETAVIGKVRSYIDLLEAHVGDIKRRLVTMKNINELAQKDTQKYVYNPLNAITLLKRITYDWHSLRDAAAKTFDIEGVSKYPTADLFFPSDEDLDSAISNLLRIQEVYKVQPQRLALGEINGVKLGSEMSWSDCLEIGRKLDDNGEFQVARFWIEIALGKLPFADTVNELRQKENTTTDGRESEPLKAKFEIMESLAVVEFHAGNYKQALDIINELIEKKPTINRLTKAKTLIKEAMTKRMTKKRTRKQKTKIVKTMKKSKKKLHTSIDSSKKAEQLLITGLCRDATRANTNPHVVFEDGNHVLRRCMVDTANLPELIIQPLKIEYLSEDPFIAVYHDVLSGQQLSELRDLVEENTKEDTVTFTKIGQKRLRSFNGKLQRFTGHSQYLFAEWRLQTRSHTDQIDPNAQNHQDASIEAHVLFELQTPKIGGTIIFPQLELSIRVPPKAILYWSNLNEFRDVDYRTKQHICLVAVGTQMTASTTIGRVRVN